MNNILDNKLKILVIRTSKHFYIRLVDNLHSNHHTLLEVSTLSQNVRDLNIISKHFAELAKPLIKDKKVFFDRNKIKYQSNIKLIADTIRSGGIIF